MRSVRSIPTPPCLQVAPTDADEPTPLHPGRPELVELSRSPWLLRSTHGTLIVRPSSTRDLPAVAQMLRRCSARSLLDRYRAGGRGPAIAALDATLRERFSVVVATTDGDVVGTGHLRRDPRHVRQCAELNVLIEDAWQRRGVGNELAAHLAGVAHVAGFTELITYPGTAAPAAQALMIDLGRTRMVPAPDAAHLHTQLSDDASLGLGSVRQRLAS